jgi:hypothetical protein
MGLVQYQYGYGFHDGADVLEADDIDTNEISRSFDRDEASIFAASVRETAPQASRREPYRPQDVDILNDAALLDSIFKETR